MLGRVSAELYVSSSANDTDFVVTLDDVRPSGLLRKQSSFLVRYGAIRMRWRDSDTHVNEPLVAGDVYKVEIDMGNTAFIFEKGHRIRLSVSSAAAPYYSANTNTGQPDLITKVTPVVAANSIFFGGSHASSVTLPVVALSQLPPNEHFATVMAEFE